MPLPTPEHPLPEAAARPHASELERETAQTKAITEAADVSAAEVAYAIEQMTPAEVLAVQTKLGITPTPPP